MNREKEEFRKELGCLPGDLLPYAVIGTIAGLVRGSKETPAKKLQRLEGLLQAYFELRDEEAERILNE